jgi:antitoxin component of MazEF toxin-antitoxin module
MGYPAKIQKVERPTNRSYYLNLPAAIAEALAVQKGETFEWEIEDKNTLILSRAKRKPARAFSKKGVS